MPLEIPPALSPGVTVQQRNSKFGNWNGTYGYYQRDSTRLDPFVTDNMRSMVYNMNDLRASKNICSTMRIANKSQVVRVDGPKTEKIRPSYLRNSVSHGTFQDFVGKQKDAWKKVSSSNDFREAFLEYAENQDSLAEDESYITMPNVPRVVRSCLGDDTPTFVLEKFCKLSKQAEVEMRVYWADFRRLAMTALATASADCTLKRELPPLVMLMSKPRINDPDLGPTKQPKTTYSDTFANYDNLLEPNNVFHKDQAESPSPHFTMSADPRPRSIMNIAAADLSAGTPKGTQQIPGFSGHMPRNIRNPRKVEHSSGTHLHPVVNSLRMTKKGGNNVLGYSGHVPWHASSERERLSGCDPRTSTGAAFGDTRLPL